MTGAPRGSEKRKRKEVLRPAKECRECQVTQRSGKQCGEYRRISKKL